MLGKILLTLGVLIIVLIYLQKKRIAEQSRRSPQSSGGATASAAPALSEYRFAAWLFLGLMLGTALLLFVLRWQEANQEVTVILHRESSGTPVIYRVSRKSLSERSFTTTDGVRVTVSASERMEVVGL